MIPELLSAGLAFAGLPVGHLLAKLAEEELEPGKQLLKILRAALAAMIVWFGTAQFLTTLLGQAAITIGVVFILSRRNLFSLAFAVWGAFLGLNIEHDSLLLLTGLVFIYGFVEAALRFQKWKMFRLIDFAFFLTLGIALLI